MKILKLSLLLSLLCISQNLASQSKSNQIEEHPVQVKNQKTSKAITSKAKTLAVTRDPETLKYGLKSKANELILDFEYDYIQQIHLYMDNVSVKMFLAKKDSSQQCLYNDQGEIVIPCVYKAIDQESDVFIVENKASKLGVLSVENELIVPIEYDVIKRIRAFDHYKYIVAQDGKHGALGSTGELEIPLKYDGIFHSGINFFVEVEGMQGVITEKDEIVIAPKYEEIYLLPAPNLDATVDFWAKLNGKYGIVTKQDEVVIPFEYDNIQMLTIEFENNFFKVKRGDKWGLINRKNKLILDFKYDDIKWKGKKKGFFVKAEENEFVSIKVDY